MMSKEENKLREQYCLEHGGINPSNIIEWYYIEWLESKLTEQPTVADKLERCFTDEFIKEFQLDGEFMSLFNSIKRGMSPYEAIEHLCKTKKDVLNALEGLIKVQPVKIEFPVQSPKQSDNSELTEELIEDILDIINSENSGLSHQQRLNEIESLLKQNKDENDL